MASLIDYRRSYTVSGMDAMEAYETVPEAVYLVRHLSAGRPLDVSTIESEVPRFERIVEVTAAVRAAATARVELANVMGELMDERRALITEIAASAGVEERVLHGR